MGKEKRVVRVCLVIHVWKLILVRIGRNVKKLLKLMVGKVTVKKTESDKI